SREEPCAFMRSGVLRRMDERVQRLRIFRSSWQFFQGCEKIGAVEPHIARTHEFVIYDEYAPAGFVEQKIHVAQVAAHESARDLYAICLFGQPLHVCQQLPAGAEKLVEDEHPAKG